MLVAVKFGAGASEPPVDESGNLAGAEAGVALVRRLLRVFPEAVLITPHPREGNGFATSTLSRLDPEAVVINMDVVDSVDVWRRLRRRAEQPKVMNFIWWNTSEFTTDIERAQLGLSCALFPTFCNSERTASEARRLVGEQTIQPYAERARIDWVNLGVRVDRQRPRADTDIPIILYPAIYMFDRKQPGDFIEVVERVARRTKIRVEARLAEKHLASEPAMKLSRHSWSWVGPLTPSKEEYWDALSRTTAFLATARDESYGLEYVEALLEGVIGVFPDRPWAKALLPEGYPFIYRNLDEAEKMLYAAVTDPAKCRAQMDGAAGGPMSDWVASRHSDDQFDSAIVRRVRTWFG